jgi:hypothetical protein
LVIVKYVDDAVDIVKYVVAAAAVVKYDDNDEIVAYVEDALD